jgi:hypothetical protein
VPPKPKRPRSERRAADRGLRKEIDAREKLAAAAPGGAAAHPLVVSSAAVIEGRAGSTPCPQCGGQLDLQRHDAVAGARAGSDRVVRLTCRLCHTPRLIYFRIQAPQAN